MKCSIMLRWIQRKYLCHWLGSGNYSGTNAGQDDVVVVKLDTDGNEIYSPKRNQQNDWGRGIGLSYDDKRIYVTGNTYGNFKVMDSLTQIVTTSSLSSIQQETRTTLQAMVPVLPTSRRHHTAS